MDVYLLVYTEAGGEFEVVDVYSSYDSAEKAKNQILGDFANPYDRLCYEIWEYTVKD